MFARLYERHGSRYIWLAPTGALIAYLLGVTMPLAAFGVARVEGLSLGRFGVLLLVFELGAALAALIWIFTIRGELRVLAGWASGARDNTIGERAMAAAHRLPLRAAVAAPCASLVTAGPVTVLGVRFAAGHLGLSDALFVYFAQIVIAMYVGSVWWSLIEVTLRPVIADIAVGAPGANRVHGRRTPLSLRTVGGLGLVAMTGGILLGCILEPFGAGGSEGLRILGFSLAVAATLWLSRIVVVTSSVLSPIRELTSAARSVGAGNLDVEIPVASTDDLGELVASFNEMVTGLREREALRERNLGLVDELRASRMRIVASAADARRRIERDLHDGAQQHLVLLRLKLGFAEQLINKDPAAAQAAHAELRSELDRALSELRDLAHGIYPAVLENDGLAAALADAARRAAIPTGVESDGVGRYAPEIEAAVYFCCLEALQNAAKHAGSNATATIRLNALDGGLAFEIVDTGAGFDPDSTATSAGIQNMKDRIGALGGTLTIQSARGRGSTVSGQIPAGQPS